MVADSVGTNDQRLPNQLQDHQRQSKAKTVKGHLIHLVGYFDCYCEILELFPLSGERNSSMIFSEPSQLNK